MSTITTDTPETRKHYRRGWDAFLRGSRSALENADDRREPLAWYLGYEDANESNHLPKYHRLNPANRDTPPTHITGGE